MRTLFLTLLLSLTTLGTTNAATPVSFNAPQRDFPVGNGPFQIASADFNGDGVPDLAVAIYFGEYFNILIGNGDGTFQPAKQISGPYQPSSIAVGDLNGDGKPDLVLGSRNLLTIYFGVGDGSFSKPHYVGNNSFGGFAAVADVNNDGNLDLVTSGTEDSIAVLLGRGDGTFQTPIFSPGATFNTLQIGDVNGDGKPDVVTANSFTAINVFLGHGDGTFTLSSSVPSYADSLALGDLNGDGRADIIAGGGVPSIAVYLSNADGTLAPPAYYPSGGYPFVNAGDMNGDGKLDVVVVSTSQQSGASTAAVLLGKGDGTLLLSPSLTSTDYGPAAFALVDLNSDGLLDVAVPASGSNAPEGVASILLGTGAGSFVTAPTYPVSSGSQPYAIGAADFNGDGRLDLITANRGTTAISLLLGNGDASFRSPLSFNETASSGITDLVTADFNGDGHPDVATSNAETGVVGVLLGDGHPSFSAPAYYPVGVDPQALAVGDFNGDRVPDIVTANAKSDSLSVLLGKGDGTFHAASPTALPADSSPTRIAVGDFNGDGKLDLVVASGYVYVLLGNGDATFQSPITSSVGAGAIAVGDCNGDGKLDIVVFGNESNFDQVFALLGNGDGTFTVAKPVQADGPASRIILADVNGDGILDAVVVSSLSNSMQVALGTGKGTFQTPVAYGAGLSPYGVVSGDFNGDTKPDIATASKEGAVVFTNTTP